MFNRGLTLGRVLFISLLFCAVIPATLIGIKNEQMSEGQELETVRQKHLLFARNIARQLEQYSSHAQETLKAVAREYREKNSLEAFNFPSFIGFQAISVYTRGRGWQLAWGRDYYLPDLNMGEIRHLMAGASVNAQPRFSNVTQSPSGQSVIYLVYPLGPNQWISASMDIRYFIQIQQSISFGKLGHAVIVDQSGNLIAHPNQLWQEQHRNLSFLDPIKSLINGQSGVTEFYSEEFKVQMLAAYVSVPQVGWGVMIPQPKSELTQSSDARLEVVKSTLILAAIVSLLVAALITYLIQSPMQSLVKASRQLSTGRAINLPKKKLPFSDVNALYQAFITMAREVQESKRMLELRVMERTRELQNEIEERKRIESDIRHAATHDSLTGLPNRQLLEDRLVMALINARRHRNNIAVMFIDIDKFKPVNDQYGHQAGDQVLKTLSERMQHALRGADTISRYAGDEFVIVMTDVCQPEDVETLARKISQLIKLPIGVKEHLVEVTASIGVLTISGGDQDLAKIMHEADILMYQAKYSKKRGIVYGHLSSDMPDQQNSVA